MVLLGAHAGPCWTSPAHNIAALIVAVFLFPGLPLDIGRRHCGDHWVGHGQSRSVDLCLFHRGFVSWKSGRSCRGWTSHPSNSSYEQRSHGHGDVHDHTNRRIQIFESYGKGSFHVRSRFKTAIRHRFLLKDSCRTEELTIDTSKQLRDGA